MRKEAVFANAIYTLLECNPQRLTALRSFFISYEGAWHASERELTHALKDSLLASTIARKRKTSNPEILWESLKEEGISLILPEDKAFPAILKTIPAPPPLLYIRGTLCVSPGMLAVVGTRAPSAYGREACKALVEPVARAGVPIISGLAMGIDAQSHHACLQAGGYAIAVVGSGLSQRVLYPATNKPLAHAILQHGGALISEYPPSFKAAHWTFPQRNRIIAGLASGVLIIEAKEKSGTLITARLALEYGRDILAVPGPIFSANAHTPNMLIKEGAVPVTSADDIFYTLGIEPNVSKKQSMDSPEEELILQLLAQEPHTANDIARTSQKETAVVQQALARLEIHGKVTTMSNGMYRKI